MFLDGCIIGGHTGFKEKKLERRALYNTLRLHYEDGEDVELEPWQVTDYRTLPTPHLFKKLAEFGLDLEPTSFHAFAEQTESPEQLTEELAKDLELDSLGQDYIYLIVFELWRRLLAERQTMSIFCDELDYQMTQYDQDLLESTEPLENTLANLQYLLNEQVDEGVKPRFVFDAIQTMLANDLESFLYDFIAERIDLENYSYATELLEGFHDFVSDPKWFVLLKARLLLATDPEEAGELIDALLKLTANEEEISFHLEVLSLLVQEGTKESFKNTLKNILSLMEVEEDFSDLLHLCEDYLHCLDEEEGESKVHDLIEKRKSIPPDQKISKNDSHVRQLLEIFINK